MKRREFMLSLSAAMAASAPLHAQQKSMPLVGSLSSFSPPANLDDLVRGSVHLGMGELGFVDGKNMVWEYRWAATGCASLALCCTGNLPLAIVRSGRRPHQPWS